MEQPCVAEAAVIGKPDALIKELVKAFISLKQNFSPSDQLRLELTGFARQQLGPAIAPGNLNFRNTFPRTRLAKA
jgi:acetyl-CoA synthetase